MSAAKLSRVLIILFSFYCILDAKSAKALTFNWQFTPSFYSPAGSGNVSGTITGLLDDTAGQLSGITVNVLSAPNGLTNTFNFTNYLGGLGFTVSGGNVTYADALYQDSSSNFLYIGTDPVNTGYFPQYQGTTGGFFSYDSPWSPTTFTSASVPSPLAILGVGAAAAFSRRIKARLKKRKMSKV